MDVIRRFFLVAIFFSGSFISSAQQNCYESSVNCGGSVDTISGQLVACLGEPIIGLIKYDSQNCLQGFIYNLVKADFMTSVHEEVVLSDAKIRLYPNPTRDFLNIDYDHADFRQLSYLIFAESGELIRKGSLSEPRENIDLSVLTPATYIFILFEESSQKIFKKKKIIKM